MLVTILTMDLKTNKVISELECDVTAYKAQQWLCGHLVWAINQGYGVQIVEKGK